MPKYYLILFMALKTETLASEHNKNVDINQKKGTELQYLIYSKFCICIDHQQFKTQQRNHIQQIIRKSDDATGILAQ